LEGEKGALLCFRGVLEPTLAWFTIKGCELLIYTEVGEVRRSSECEGALAAVLAWGNAVYLGWRSRFLGRHWQGFGYSNYSSVIRK